MGGLSNFMGGLGIAYQGLRAGERDAIGREQAVEDRAYQLDQRRYLEEQRAVQREQQERVRRDNARADTLRDDLGKIAPSGPVAVQPVATGGPDALTDPESATAQNGFDVGVPTQPAQQKVRSQDEELREVAAAYRKAGDIKTSFDLTNQADKIGMQRSAELLRSALANMQGKTAFEIAQATAEIYNTDPMPGQISKVVDLGGGAARVTLTNRASGKEFTQDFKSPEELTNQLKAHYSPQTWDAELKARQAALLKTQGEVDKARAKSFVVPSGSMFVPGAGDPRAPVTNTNFRPAAGVRAPTDKSVRENSTLGQAQAILKNAFASGAGKEASPVQRADAENFLDRVVQQAPGIPPARAARIATIAATDPTATVPSFNPQTGTIDKTYVDEDGARYALTPNFVPPDATKEQLAAKGITPDMMKLAAENLVQAQEGGADVQTKFRAAAFEPAARAALFQEATTAARKAIDQAIAANPAAEPQIRARADEGMRAFTANVGRKLELVKAWGEPPKGGRPASTGFSFKGITRPGGIAPPAPAGSPQARYDERRAAERAVEQERAQARTAESTRLSAQFDADAGSMEPSDFVRKYDGMRRSLSAGDAKRLFEMTQQIR